MTEAAFCFACWPGGPVTPPPCLQCGSRRRYFTNGLCARCHRFGDDRVDSCLDCLAWGATAHSGWRCIACAQFARRHPVGVCRTCKRSVALNAKGFCRLCARQRTYLVTDHRWGRVEDANRDGQQLFFADTFRQNGVYTPYTPRGPVLDVPVARPVCHRQQILFDWPRDMANGQRRGFPDPPDPQLAAFFTGQVDAHGDEHGWAESMRTPVKRGIRILLALQDTPGAPIRGSELLWTMQLGISTPGMSAVLMRAGFFVDDREPPIVAWFATQTADLPTEMRRELAVWFDVMRHGSTQAPRRKPRQDDTTRNQLHAALPAIHSWACRYTSLREVTRSDVKAVLPASGSQRALMLQGLRGIFRILKDRGLVFINPTGWMKEPSRNYPIPKAVDLDQVRAALNSPNPAGAAIAALLAFHAVQLKQLRAMQLTDIRDGRLHVDEHVILLADPVRERLAAWLDYRNQRWPNTANPHLFLSYKSATRTGPASPPWFTNQIGMPALGIRQDRILNEAFSTSGDLRALIDLFGLSAAGAYRYTAVVDRAHVELEQAATS